MSSSRIKSYSWLHGWVSINCLISTNWILLIGSNIQPNECISLSKANTSQIISENCDSCFNAFPGMPTPDRTFWANLTCLSSLISYLLVFHVDLLPELFKNVNTSLLLAAHFNIILYKIFIKQNHIITTNTPTHLMELVFFVCFSIQLLLHNTLLFCEI